MALPLVSIVLPTYNGAKFIATSIESCLQQTYSNIELIIINDCSTDNTEEIIYTYLIDKRVKYFKNDINKKLPLSLNYGFEKANGDYFTWTSDDNYYAPSAIEIMVNALENDKQKKLVYANYTTINDDGNITGTKLFGDVNSSMVDWKGCGACFMYTADIHNQLKGYDASAFLIEDYDFFVRALLLTKFIYLPDTSLYYYRLHANSLTSLYGFYNFDLQKIVIERKLNQLLAICSEKDKIKWLRKYAVYYGVHKSNNTRMRFYLRELSNESFSHANLTRGYIIFLKLKLLCSTILGLVISIIKKD